MPPKRQKRGREGSGGDGDGGGGGGGGDGRGAAIVRGGGGSTQAPAPPVASPAPATKRLCLPCDPEIRCCGCIHRQIEACPSVQAYQRKFEAAMSRFMAEMTEPPPSPCGLTPSPRERIEQNLLPTYKLTFANTMSDKIIFTKREVKTAGGGPLKIKMAVSNQQDSNCAQLLSANVKVVVLDGDFNENNRESWTLEEFESHIVRPRDKVGVVLTGKLELKLKNGEAHVENITFGDISKFTRSGKFRLGVMLIDDLGERVQEGITEPFTVKDRRGEGYKKFDIPTLEDKVWRVEKIAKNGPFCKALEQNGITLVKHFMRQYHKDKKSSAQYPQQCLRCTLDKDG